ncbi:UDP-N-acetylmuramoylalanine--D-glutamate ligase [Abditibacteriota bacterium]|nr:UDP-N-acetylmuramoylalanine--D-glutamate ligase [Abditibacteriota bacterium]
MNEFENKRAAVIGLARAGMPAARFLIERGARVVGYDSKAREAISPQILELEAAGVELQLGDHNFVGIEKCDLVVLSPGLKVHFEPLKSVIERVEASGGEVIGELELASRFCPCPMIGVTGTKGKSTTVKLITEMLRACGIDAISAGNTGTPLISILPELGASSCAVVEVSSFQLEKAPTFKPRVAALLSLLEDHQDYHPDLEQYWETKLKLFANQGEGDVAIFNVDDPRVEAMFVEFQTSASKLDSSAQEGTKSNGHPWIKREGQFLKFTGAPSEQPFLKVEDIPIRGAHNLSNVAAALLAVEEALATIEDSNDSFEKLSIWNFQDKIADAIRNFQTLPHRLEVVAQQDGVTYVNDSQSTIPDASIAALRAFSAPVSLLLGGRAKIEAESYENLMRAVRDANTKIYLFGEAAPMLEDVAHRENVENLYIFRENTLAEVLQLAKMNAASGETIVLSPACASFDQFSSYEERGETFRRLARML